MRDEPRRIQLHDHADGNSGGKLAASATTTTAAPGGSSSSGGSGGFDGIAEDLATVETDTTKRLAPTGTGGVDWVTEAASGGLGWFNIEDYGAANDGSTVGTAGADAAIAALNAAGGGVLYLPAGAGFTFDAALTTITVPCLILGDGGGRTAPATTVNCTSTTANLFTFTSDGVTVRGIFFNQTGGTATAGAALHFTTGQWSRVIDCSIILFYVGVFADQPVYFTAADNYVSCVLYGFQIRNTTDPDQGDWTLTRNTIVPNASGAGIRIESSGGGRIINNKINASDAASSYGIQLAFASGTTTILLIEGNSIENVKANGIDIATSGTATWSQIIITGNEFGLFNNTAGSAISLNANTAGHLSEVVIDANSFVANSNANPAITLTKVNDARIGGNVRSGFGSLFSTTSCTNIVDATGAVAAGVLITGTPSSGDVPIASSGTAAAWGPGSGVGPAKGTPATSYGTPAAGAATTYIGTGATIAKPTAPDVDFSADVTNNNVTSGHHGLAPKSPADATQFLNGAATSAFAAVKDSDLSTSDITTNDVSSSKHGFAPKGDGNATHYLDGTGAYSVPAGSSSGAAPAIPVWNVTFNGDGATTVFYLPAAPYDAYSIAVYVGTGRNTDWTLSGAMLDVLTFGSAPVSGTNNVSIDIMAST